MDIPDHRRLGRELKIFATEEECGAGLPFWLPAGAAVRSELARYVTELERHNGYRHVSTPAMAKRSLYERSGHWAYYQHDMYPPIELGSEQLVLRPMLCPHHILIYDSEPRPYRELPYRLAELGAMFRNERSGAVGGLSRVRQMTLNTATCSVRPSTSRRRSRRSCRWSTRPTARFDPATAAAILTRRTGRQVCA
jgi:threonyl-tRNA synthetase